MKRTLHAFLVLITSLSVTFCSEYSVKTDMKLSSALSKIKKAGLIFRLSNSSKISKEELVKSSYLYLPLYNSAEKIPVINYSNDEIHYYKTTKDRFYQLSDTDSYLKFKSIGVVNFYLRKNENDLKSIISSQNLDAIIIYDTYSVISTEMQFMDLDSVIAIADKNLNILYLDHQSDSFQCDYKGGDLMKDKLLNKINERLINILQSLDIIGDRLDEDEISKKEIRIDYKEEVNPPVVEQEEDLLQKAEEKPEKILKNKDTENIPNKSETDLIKESGIKSEIKLEVKPEVKPEKESEIKSEDNLPAE